jgi:succinate dehydrogenase/fumarate reductase cytochrome b subunit
MKKIFYSFSLLLVSAIAIPVLAATPTTFKQLINDVFISGLLKPLVPLLIGLAVVVFIYGVLILMFSEGGEKKEEGKQYMLWGIIGIFVMVSVWGLVNILKGTFGLDPAVPKIEIKLP